MSEGRAGGQAEAERVLGALVSLPGGPELLALAEERPDVALVGGATRDLLLGRVPRELDLVLAAGAGAFAHELAARVGGAGGSATVTIHDRFGTAAVEWSGGRVDVAERRAESYPAPGALPEVRPGGVEEDLERRDFTLNAIAIALGGPHRGRLDAAPLALEDLHAGRLRVLHERSFLEDPTRLLRLARYGARLGFEPEPQTAELAARALAGGALGSVSPARVGSELRLALGEADPLGALQAMAELGALAALEPRLAFDERLARRALAALPPDGRPDLLLLGQLLMGVAGGVAESEEARRAMLALLDGWEFTAADRDRALRTALLAPGLLAPVEAAARPSQLRELLAGAPLEAVALAAGIADGERSGDGASSGELGGQGGGARSGELGSPGAAAARRWLGELRHVRLEITGDDLLAAGVPAGSEIGRRLELALRRRLDGELADGREAELAAATEGS